MTEQNIIDLDDFLKQDTARFTKKRRLLLFKDLIYKPTCEKVILGFRYFACPAPDLRELFAADNFEGISKLPYALDEDDEPDTSSLLINLAYTTSGAYVAAQLEQYQDHRPSPIAPVKWFEGDKAKKLAALFKELDQSN